MDLTRLKCQPKRGQEVRQSGEYHAWKGSLYKDRGKKKKKKINDDDSKSGLFVIKRYRGNEG